MSAILKEIVVFEDRLRHTGSYWNYLSPPFGQHLNDYLTVFEKYRNDISIKPSEEDWKLLPFGAFAKHSSWKWRRESLKMIRKMIGKSHFDTILEVGSWNGWLTKYLATKSEIVIGVDYFTDAFDGVGNIAALHKNIIPVQCNVAQIASEFKPDTFELIVLNHNLNYMDAPADYIRNLIPLLKPDGKIISLGNTVYRNPKEKQSINDSAAQDFRKKYKMDLYIQPVKGFLDTNDLEIMHNAGFQTKNYPNKMLQNAYSKIYAAAPKYIAITYQNYNHNEK